MAQWPALLMYVLAVVDLSAATAPERAEVPGDPSAWQQILAQNRELANQLKAQQTVIENLTAQLAEMRQATARHERELQDLHGQIDAPSVPKAGAIPARDATVRLSGELGLAFFRTGSSGAFPNSEFRIDDAKVFLEAQVWKNVYAYSELNLLTRESNDETFHIGELYVDFENVSALWGQRGRVNVRVGRFNIPFGEEYRSRGVMANPLISHSLSDIWGVDEGVEIYGQLGRFSYVAAVQNGGHSLLHDADADKALMARVGVQPWGWLALSASAMRTGALSTQGDVLSEVWFGGGFFRALGPPATTRTFHANLYEGDATAHWPGGHLAAAIGQAKFGDDDTSRSNARTISYGFLEGLQKLSEKLYGVVRYSAIRAPKGYPLVGGGTFGGYFFSPLLTEKLDRWSFGFGYRIGPPLVLKFEYTKELGRLTTGATREGEDFFGTEIGLKF